MAKNDNLTDFLTDIADAIRAKKGTLGKINPQNFASEIASLGGEQTAVNAYGWTGHADVEGLTALGWDDYDIDYYQKFGVNWNEEDDDLHKVSDANKALRNISLSDVANYQTDLVYLPKIDLGSTKTLNGAFRNCYNLVAIPVLDTSKITNMGNMFRDCYSLVTIPMLDTSSATSMTYMFANCYSLISIPFLATTSVTTMTYMFNNCYSLTDVENLQVQGLSSTTSMFNECRTLKNVWLRGICSSVQFEDSNLLSKNSLLDLIISELTTTSITIKLAPFAYLKWANDPEVLEVLTQHPNISIAQ